ncbi:MAG TPA: DUF222 domain-containing protein [Aeromicrobium sp.]|nr:DUF222 domain-containing protein [Aeromicrobium sp.]
MFRLALEVGEERRAALTRSTVALARAEFEQWNELVITADGLNAQVDAESDYFRRMVLRSAIPLTLGRLTGLSEGQVSSRLAVAERVRSKTPNTWAAFAEGRVDGARVREISRAVDTLKVATSWERLDKVGLAYAETHTVAEVRSWVKRFVARVEPEGFNARADEERRLRRVEISHGDDGMSWISAYVPSFVAAATDNRLNARVKEIRLEGDPDEERTKVQLRADLLAEWVLSADRAPASLNIDVAVTVPVTALTGSSGLPTESADGQWGIPTAWAYDQYVKHSSFWHRMIVDPVANDVLAHEYLGRYAPDVLARAIIFRDKTCKAPGCCKPAAGCDMDHRRPWPEGPTSGDNVWALCRKHHSHKGHGILQWQTPDGHTIPVEKADVALAS